MISYFHTFMYDESPEESQNLRRISRHPYLSSHLWFRFLSTSSSLLSLNHLTMANSSSVVTTKLRLSLSMMSIWSGRWEENLWGKSEQRGQGHTYILECYCIVSYCIISTVLIFNEIYSILL